jgi:hypothetical protein
LYSKNKIWQRRREGIDQSNRLRFSSIENISLHKHLKDNVSDYLKNKIGVNTKDRVNIVERIFGDNRIQKSKDEYQFEERCNIITTMDGNNEQFCKYFANTLKPKLTEFQKSW